jgi:hypothetical protein
MTAGYLFYKFVKRNGRVFGPYKYHRVWLPDLVRQDTYLGKASMDEYNEWRARHDAVHD